jgi:hypothetical protein
MYTILVVLAVVESFVFFTATLISLHLYNEYREDRIRLTRSLIR